MANLPVLLRIQEVLNRLQSLNQTADMLKKDPKLSKLRADYQKGSRQLEKTIKDQQQQRQLINKLELDLKASTEHIKSEEVKLYNGSVTSPRELEQIQTKVREYQNHQKTIEEQLFSQMEEDERLTEAINQLKLETEKAKREVAEEQQQITSKQFENKLEMETLQQELDELVAELPPELWEKFQKIANSHNGVAIARMKHNACGGCHVSLSDSMLAKVKRGDDQFLFCENCGRILYYG